MEKNSLPSCKALIFKYWELQIPIEISDRQASDETNEHGKNKN